MLRGCACAIADREFSQIAAWKVGAFAHPQPGDAEVLLDVDILNSPRGQQVGNLLVQERADPRKVSHVSLLEMREGIFVVDDFEYRKCRQLLIREDAGADQGKVRLTLQTSLECLEFT